MVNLNLRFNARTWLQFPVIFHLVVSSPIFGFIAYALWTDNLSRLLLGVLTLAAYLAAASVTVRLFIRLDTQCLQHQRLPMYANGVPEQVLLPPTALEPSLLSMDMSAHVVSTGARISQEGFSACQSNS